MNGVRLPNTKRPTPTSTYKGDRKSGPPVVRDRPPHQPRTPTNRYGSVEGIPGKGKLGSGDRSSAD